MKKLTCHCGEVEIQINLKKEINELMRCNCSMCKRKGTMVTTINKRLRTWLGLVYLLASIQIFSL